MKYSKVDLSIGGYTPDDVEFQRKLEANIKAADRSANSHQQEHSASERVEGEEGTDEEGRGRPREHEDDEDEDEDDPDDAEEELPTSSPSKSGKRHHLSDAEGEGKAVPDRLRKKRRGN